MQQVFNETQPRSPTSASSQNTPSPSQDGFAAHSHGHGQLSHYAGSASPSHSESSRSTSEVSLGGIDIDQFTERLRRLNTLSPHLGDSRKLRGQSIANYENGGVVRASPMARRRVGFKVIPRQEGAPADGTSISDMPNEILTHILSYLNPKGYASLALVSRKFYNLVRSQYAWRVAFRRFFSGQTTLDFVLGGGSAALDWDGDDAASESHLPTHHYFARLTSLATWQSEYFLRTQLLRSLAKAKPGLIVGDDDKLAKAKFPTLTYDSRVPCAVTNIHVEFTNKEPRLKAVHGGADLGRVTTSNPGTGNIGEWGLTDNAELHLADHIWPQLGLAGQNRVPVTCPNVMDVSVAYGAISGEGFPGGQPFYRPAAGLRARYIDRRVGVFDSFGDIPRIPSVEGISSVWIAKTPLVPNATGSLVGIMTGSTLGVVTTYVVGQCHKLRPGDMSARWALCPGVPIVSLKVDDNYDYRRRQAGRVWAVALNALGEVFYLKEVPSLAADGDYANHRAMLINAWISGRSAQWHLLESTARQAKCTGDESSDRPPQPPRSSPQSFNLSNEEQEAEALRISHWLRREPSFFKAKYDGWEMKRRLEVDFSGDDRKGAGEAVFVVDCGLIKTHTSRIQRYVRSIPAVADSADDWDAIGLAIPGDVGSRITATAIDMSLFALPLRSEDPLCSGDEQHGGTEDGGSADSDDLPGRRSRFIAAGFDDGSILLWNARHEPLGLEISPLRMIHTDSPRITALALTALYLVHGGSDGLVQAWDPLGSTLAPLRTINTRSGSHVSRHINNINPGLANLNHSAARCIYLDPDPTKLRGVVSFGAFLRSWSFNSPGQEAARRREKAKAHPDYDHRRKSGKLRADDDDDPAYEQMQTALRAKFGLASGPLGDLTEEEAVMYAQMISRESFMEDEQRRSASIVGSASASSDWPPPGASVSAGLEAGSSSAPLDGILSDEELARRLAALEEADALARIQDEPAAVHPFEENMIKVTYKKPRNKKARKQSAGSGSGGDYGPDSSPR